MQINLQQKKGPAQLVRMHSSPRVRAKSTERISTTGLVRIHFSNLKSVDGFTIIEAFVAISILLVAIAGPLTFVTSSLSSAIFAKEQLIATFLAQEALEMARNKRDDNIIAGDSWLNTFDPTICGAPDGCIVDPDVSGTASITFTSCSGNCPVLRFNPASGLYGYNSAPNWEATIFTRKLIVSEVVSGVEAVIDVSVSWETGFSTKTISSSNTIFNWQQ